MGFYDYEHLQNLGFASIGENVMISDKSSIYNAQNIYLGDNVRIDDFCILSAGEGGIYIRDHVHIACYVSIIGKGKIELQDFCGISGRTSIYSSNDDYSGNFLTGPTVPEQYKNVFHSTVRIGRHVIIGVNCCVLPGVVIGNGSAIGAFSLVNKNIEAGVIAMGIPAKKIKKRSSNVFELEKKLKQQNRKI
jgi:dTDP-4-amino-4,6-dideoxy-D-glucose acyltransferase